MTTLEEALVRQESGGDYSAVNKDSGALGKYQIMPFHLPKVGLPPNEAGKKAFLESPALQDQLFKTIVGDLKDQFGDDPRKVAAAYYGGEGAVKKLGTSAGDTPQGAYPSINDYVKSVMGHMGIDKLVDVPPKPLGKPWSEVEKTLDPMMPAEQFDALRATHFRTNIAPQIRDKDMLKGTFDAFMQQTQRKPLMSPGDQLMTRLGHVTATAFKEAIAPTRMAFPEVYNSAWRDQAKYAKMLERDGIDPSGEEFIAGMAGQALALAPLFAATGPMAGAIEKSFLGGMKGAHMLAAAARGGTVFATFDALSAEEGSRTSAGVRGFIWGALGEGLLSGFHGAPKVEAPPTARGIRGYFQPTGLGEPERGFQRMGPSPETGFTHKPSMSVEVVDQRMIGAPEQRLIGGPPEQRLLPERVGNPTQQMGTVRAGRGRISRLWEAGGDLATPQTQQAVVEAVKEAKSSGAMSTPPVLTPQANRFGVTAVLKNAAGKVTTVAVKKGAETEFLTAVDTLLKSGGSIEGLNAHPTSMSRAAEIMSKLTERMTPPEDRLPELPTHNDVRFPDQTSMELYKAGEIRARIQDSGKGEGFTVPRAEHADLHTTLGDIGEKLAMPRANAGDLALDYYRKVEDLGLKGQPMVAPTADEGIDAIKGRMSEKGIVVEGRPPRGYTLKAMAELVPNSERANIAKEGGVKVRVRPEGVTRLNVPMSENEFGFTTFPEGGRGDATVSLGAKPDRKEIFHEYLHRGLYNTGATSSRIGIMDLWQGTIHPMAKVAALDIGQALKGLSSYAKYPLHQLIEEAYVHTATAFRLNDTATLKMLAEVDTSVEHLGQLVNDVSSAVKTHLQGLPDSGGARGRIMERRMNDLLRRTSPHIQNTLNNDLGMMGAEGWYDPAIDKWAVRESDGTVTNHKTLNDVHDWMEKNDPSGHGPETAFMADLSGIKGPGIPEEGVPNGTLPQPDLDIPGRGISWFSGTLGFRPMINWVAALDGKINAALKGAGRETLGLFDAWKAVDSAHHEGSLAASKAGQEVKNIIKGVPSARRTDIGEVIAAGVDNEAAMAAAHKLSPEELKAVRGLRTWMEGWKQKTGIDMERIMSELRTVRATGETAPYMHSAVRSGNLTSADLHAGKLLDWGIRRGVYESFVQDPLSELDNLVRTNGATLGPTKGAFQQYVKHMRGVPDSTQNGLKALMGDILNGANAKIASMNKLLGTNIKADFNMPVELINKAMLFQFAMGLGGRASVFVRDTYQMMNAMSVVGPTAFTKGLTKALTREGWKAAEEAGALLKSADFGADLTGIGTGKVEGFLRGMLAPSRIGHNVGRAATYHAEYETALSAIKAFKSTGDASALFNDTTMWWLKDAQRTRLLDIISKSTVEEGARQVALDVVDATQWALRKGTQPQLLQTGLGRVLGQYGQWPMNYMSYVGNLAKMSVENPAKGIPALGRFIAMNTGAVVAAEALGADVSKWVFISPAGYKGSPALEFLTHMYEAPENTDQGRTARRQILNLPLEFIPTGVQAQEVLKVINTPGMSEQEKWVRLLGFRPMKESEDLDWADWAKWQAGFGKPKP